MTGSRAASYARQSGRSEPEATPNVQGPSAQDAAENNPARAVWSRYGYAAAVAVLAVAVATLFRGYVKDDAYISFRYAYNLTAGRGLVFNPGEPLEGYTNFLWVMLAALAHVLGASPTNAIALWVVRIVALASLASLPFAIQNLAGHLGVTSQRGRIVAAGCALATAIHPAVGLYAMSGMEAVPLVALTIWTVERVFAGRIGMALTLATTAALLRPEGHVLWLIAAAAALSTRRWRPLLATSGVLASYHAFRWVYFGALLPNTFRVKSGGGWFPWRGTEVAVDTLLYGSGPLLLAGAALGLLLVRTRRVAATFAFAAFFVAYLIWVGGDTMRWGRLELPALPLLAAVATVGFDAVLRAFESPAPRLAGWLAFLPLALAPLLDARDLQDRIAGASPVHEAMWANQYRAGRDLAAWLPAGSWVVGQDMGLMPYTTPELRFIDSVGLVSGEVAEILARYRITPYGVKVADPVLAEANTELAYAEIRDRIFAHNPAAFILVAHVPTATPALAAAAQTVGPLRAYRGYFGTFARRLDRDPRLEEGFVLVKQYARAADYVLLVFVRKDLAARIPANR